MKTSLLRAMAAFALLSPALLAAQVPNLIPQQGRVAVNGVNFDGTGQFKFALVNGAGTISYWSNDGTSSAGSQPAAAVPLAVTKGLYSVQLGDTALPNMTAVPAAVFAHADLRVRVWFNNGALGFQQLTPDQRLATNGYIPDGAVTSAKLAAGATAGSVTVTGTTQTAVANTSYVTTAATDTRFTLPPAANIGDTIRISAAGAGGWIVPSGDNFPIWTPRDSVRTWTSVASSADGTKLLASTSPGFLYTSTDSGVTWTARATEEGWTCATSSSDGTKLAAVSSGLIYISSNSGVTWTASSPSQNWVSIASSADGTWLVAAAYEGQLHTSSDSGANWTPRGVPGQWWRVNMSADGARIYAYKIHGEVSWSDDLGNSWSDRPGLNVDVNATASSANTDRLAVAPSGSPLQLSTDGWQSSTQREIPRTWRSIASSSDGSRLVAGADGQGLFTSSNFGETWKPWDREHGFGWTDVASSADGRKLVATAFEGHIYTAEGLMAYGLPGSEGTLQYTGGGQWRAVGVPQGTITGGQLENKAVSRDHLASDIGVWRAAGAAVYRNTNENVGIGTASPRYPLTFANSAFSSARVALYDSGSTPPTGIGASSDTFRLQVNGAASRFAFGVGNSGNEMMTIKGTGQVGIGTTSPNFPLSLGGGAANTKLSLYDAAGSTYGLGIGSAQFRLHVDNPSARFSFLDAPAGNEIMTIAGTGQIGIGTTTPNFPLSLGSSSMNTKLALWEGFGGAYGMGIAAYQFRLHLDAPSARFSFLDAPAGNELMTILGTGNVGIGRTPAANRLELEGNASKTTAGSWLANSDRRIKTNITPVTNALATLDKVNPVTFRYTEEYRKAHPGIPDVPYYNVIAQEFREVFPNAVKSSGEKLPDGSEILQVDTYPATITALAAIKELKAENEALRADNRALADRLAKIERVLGDLPSAAATAKTLTPEHP